MDAIPRLASSTTPAATDTYTPTRSSSSAALPQFGLNRGHLLRLHDFRPSPLLYSRSHTTSPLNSPYVLSPSIPASLRVNRFKNLFSTSESPSRDERTSEGGFKSWVDGLKSRAKRALHENEKSEIEFNGWIESEERRQRALFEFPASIFAEDEDNDTVQSVAFETLGNVLLQEKQKRETEIAEEHAAKKRRRMQEEEGVPSMKPQTQEEEGVPSMKPLPPPMSAPVSVSDERIRRSPIRIYEDPQSRSGSEYNGYGGSIQSEDEYGEIYADENINPHREAGMDEQAGDEALERGDNDAETAAEDRESVATAPDIQAEELSDAGNPTEYDYEEDQEEPADSSLHVEQEQEGPGLQLFTTTLPIDPALFSAADDLRPDRHKTDVEDGHSDQKVEHINDEEGDEEHNDLHENEFADDDVEEEVEEEFVERDYDDQEEYDDGYDEYDDFDEEYEQDQEASFLPQFAGKIKPISVLVENYAYSSPPASDLAEEEYESEDESEASAIDQPPTKKVVVQSEVIELSSDESGDNQENGSSPSLSSESDEDSYDNEPDELEEEQKGSMWTPSIPGTKTTRVLNDLVQRNRPSLIDTLGTARYAQDEDEYSDDGEYDEEELENGNHSGEESGEPDDEISESESEQSFQQAFQDDEDPEEVRQIAREERLKELATEEADQEMVDVEDNSQINAEVGTQIKATRTVDEGTEESEAQRDDEVFIEEEAQTPLVHESDSDPNERFPEEDDYWEGNDNAQRPASTVVKSPEFEKAENEYSIETRKHSTFSLEVEDNETVTPADLDNVFLQANAQGSK
ncbi:hypothetical protein V1522DRAFT_172435 [Lipomyces starkeyi]